MSVHPWWTDGSDASFEERAVTLAQGHRQLECLQRLGSWDRRGPTAAVAPGPPPAWPAPLLKHVPYSLLPTCRICGLLLPFPGDCLTMNGSPTLTQPPTPRLCRPKTEVHSAEDRAFRHHDRSARPTGRLLAKRPSSSSDRDASAVPHHSYRPPPARPPPLPSPMA